MSLLAIVKLNTYFAFYNFFSIQSYINIFDGRIFIGDIKVIWIP